MPLDNCVEDCGLLTKSSCMGLWAAVESAGFGLRGLRGLRGRESSSIGVSPFTSGVSTVVSWSAAV